MTSLSRTPGYDATKQTANAATYSGGDVIV